MNCLVALLDFRDHKNNDIAQYTSNKAKIGFTILARLDKILQNAEPKTDQATVPVKPKNARKKANPTNVKVE